MAKPNSSAPLGQGGRFAALKQSLSSRPGVKNAGALAASIGRKKFGAQNFAKLASHMPEGGSLSPKGDIGALRQRESEKVGGFKAGKAVSVAGVFGDDPEDSASYAKKDPPGKSAAVDQKITKAESERVMGGAGKPHAFGDAAKGGATPAQRIRKAKKN